jgi:hypothetical protein
MTRWTRLTDLSFFGGRFEEPSVLLEVGQELATFQRLVTKLAEDLWYLENPDSKRLPNNFDASTKLRFKAVKDGSTTLPIDAPIENETEKTLFGERPSPYVEQAIQLLIEAIRSQEHKRELPPRFPRNRIDGVIQLGSTLHDDEGICIGNGRSQSRATYARATRERFREYHTTYYEDVITLYGEIRAIDKDGHVAQLRLPNKRRVEVRFLDDQQRTFMDALQWSSAVLTGLVEMSKADGFIRRVKSVTELSPVETEADDESLTRWIASRRHDSDWELVPADLSSRLDDYLHPGSPEV